MIYQVTVPPVAEDVEEIRILEWRGEAGQAFAAGELLVEFETYKALVEVRAGQAGVLRQVLAQAGDWVRIDAPIALFSDGPDEPLPDQIEGVTPLPIDFLVD